MALLLGFGLAFLLEMLDSTVKTQDDIENKLGLPFLGLIPSIQPGKERSARRGRRRRRVADSSRAAAKDLYVLSHPKSAVAECCRAIRTNLLFMLARQAGRASCSSPRPARRKARRRRR